MLTVALDTSTRSGSVALAEVRPGTRPVDMLGELTPEVSATHSETVLPALDRLLRAFDRRPRDVDAVVVGAGPGSFTGVRIGAALARGVCFAGGAELFAFSSLAAVAASAGPDVDVCALIDARREQVYGAGYGFSRDGFTERFAPRAGTLSGLLATLDVEAWTFAGVLSDDQRETIRVAGGRLLPPERGRPTAAGLLRLLALSPDEGRVPEPARWEPEYVRGSSARRRAGGG